MPEPLSTPTPSDLRRLRDASVLEARRALTVDDWRTALACLFRAQRYDNQANAIEQDATPPLP
jgi:hypothetical protein